MQFWLPLAGLRNPSQDLIGGQRDDAEHQMAHCLRVTSYANRAATELIFQMRIDPLHDGAFAVNQNLLPSL